MKCIESIVDASRKSYVHNNSLIFITRIVLFIRWTHETMQLFEENINNRNQIAVL